MRRGWCKACVDSSRFSREGEAPREFELLTASETGRLSPHSKG
jgi:hypothetical protein